MSNSLRSQTPMKTSSLPLPLWLLGLGGGMTIAIAAFMVGRRSNNLLKNSSNSSINLNDNDFTSSQ
jgi:membrane fusion protein, heavy metal efflux system